MKTFATGVSAVHLGGSRIRFTCPLGHETVKDYSRGAASERLSESAAHRLALMWGIRIHIPFTCHKCRPAARRPARTVERHPGRVSDPPSGRKKTRRGSS